MSDRHESWSRREFAHGLALATAASLGVRPALLAAEPLPETKKLKLSVQRGGVCLAPKYVADTLLRSEGFADIEYVAEDAFSARMKLLASGGVDIDITYAAPLIIRVDAGDPILILAGAHAGCFELFGSDRVRAIRDLKGKTVAISELGGTEHTYIASMVAYVGLDPRKDIAWAVHPQAEAIRLLAAGKVDAFISVPPGPQELRARKIGRVVVNSLVHRPWSQYFCCVVVANREFVRRNPVASKRALRGILKAVDLCTLEPDRAAQLVVDRGVTDRRDYALQTMKELPYGRWREYDAEDTLRFYALRLHEAGMTKSSPQKIMAQGTDWRFLNELKRELKG